MGLVRLLLVLAASAFAITLARASAIGLGEISIESRGPDLAPVRELIEDLKTSPAINLGDLGGSGKRKALVVGNNDYELLPVLRKAVDDARSLSAVLGELGFSVTSVFDADEDELADALDRFYRGLGKGDVAFFFFAGHGIASGDANYLLPTDMRKLEDLQMHRLDRDAFNASEIVTNIKQTGARIAFIVLDACREDPFRGDNERGATALGGLTRMQPTEGAFVIYSAGTGQTALDSLEPGDPDPNSVFSRKFFPILETPGLPVVEIAKRTQVEVRELAAKVAHKQAPAYYDQVIGQFYFRAPEPSLYGLAIGIDEYDRVRQLRGAVNDAERVARALEAVGAKEVVRIYDRDARRMFIDYAWRSMVERAKPGDTLVFSFSGSSAQFRGANADKEPDGLDEFLPLADAGWQSDLLQSLTNDSPIIITDDALTEWMELAADRNINVILMIDGCHGGGMLDREFANVSFLGASLENELVMELIIGERYHAAMSYAFADGIEGKADLNGDGFITQQELYAHLSLEIALFLDGRKQTPQFSPAIGKAANDLALFRLPVDLSQRKATIAERPWPETDDVQR